VGDQITLLNLKNDDSAEYILLRRFLNLHPQQNLRTVDIEVKIIECSGVKVRDPTKLLNLKSDDSAECILAEADSLHTPQNLRRILKCR
jgi:hypothetical protein